MWAGWVGGEGGRARVRSYRAVGPSGGGICRLAFVGAHLGAMGWRGRRSRPSALLRGEEGPLGLRSRLRGREGVGAGEGEAEAGAAGGDGDRSEENTSELQSLMRNSSAVF